MRLLCVVWDTMIIQCDVHAIFGLPLVPATLIRGDACRINETVILKVMVCDQSSHIPCAGAIAGE
jgi:hypothetical protein